MQQLIEDLLAFSKIGQGERTFVKTDIKTIIDEVKSDFRDVLKDKKATLEVKKTITATIIPFQFRQMMHNLVGNSLKFLNPEIPLHIVISGQLVKWNKLEKKHSIDIVLAKGAQLADKDYCYITVNDNGIGFEAQFQDKIFEVFQRLHNKDTYEGTGIGLAIVKKIVENHQGFIYATGVLNKGATFHIYLPNHH